MRLPLKIFREQRFPITIDPMTAERRILTILSLSLVILLTAGCASQSRPAENGQGLTGSASLSDLEGTDSTGEPDHDSSGADSLGAATPTPDNRLQPEDWQDWPVVPTLSPALIELYNQGIEQGNRENAFSKVGDCQIIPDVFLGIFDEITYSLPAGMEDLEGTLDRFQGSFAREGYALKGGFVFPTVFSPLRADSSVCDPGETPFECELRIHQPSFVLISMEFRYDGRTAETHETYLRRAVEYALDRGIIPILATKADNFEGDHSLNLTTAKIAYEYDLPLWNYWRAVQNLPNQGIDWDRDSYGFHVTPEAWLMRSETFLKVLHSLVRDIEISGSPVDPAGPAAPTAGPEPTAEIVLSEETAPQPAPDPTPIADWGSAHLIFDLQGREFGKIIHHGIYSADLAAGEISQLSGEGTQLLGLAPDYQQLLVRNGESLFILDLSTGSREEISSNLYPYSPSAAAWDQGSNLIYYLASENGQVALYRFDPQTAAAEALPASRPISILSSSDGAIVWSEGSCNQFGNCTYARLKWAAHSGKILAERELGESILLPCQTGQEFLYAERDGDGSLSFHIQSLVSGTETIFWSLNTEYADCAWSPDRQQVAVTLIDRGWYSGTIEEYHFQLYNPDSGTIQDLSFLGDLTEQINWSPDGKLIIFSNTVQQINHYQVQLSLYKLEDMSITRLEVPSDFSSENYLAVNQLYWLP